MAFGYQCSLSQFDLPLTFILRADPERRQKDGSISTNIYLRRIHNFALDINWLPWPVLPMKRWPAIKFKEKRGITWEEHQAIVARELNPGRKAFYQLAWHLGAAQSDIAFLEARPRVRAKPAATSYE